MIRLEDTNGNVVAAAIASERSRMGSSATGMVLTLLVMASEETQADAVLAASQAAREHPMRILVFIPRKERGPARLDAEISVGGDQGPGELAILRLRGALAAHAGSVAIPLLLPDTPVVAWWPGQAPDDLADDPIGRHAIRRITDASTVSRSLHVLDIRRSNYAPGDTDLAWTRVTPWRSMLAAALDQPTAPITGIEVTCERSNPSGPLLASWLHLKLGSPVTLKTSRAPGISTVELTTTNGSISLTRPDGHKATLSITGHAPATVALSRRDLTELLVEELRRLDPDEVYSEALLGLPHLLEHVDSAAAKRAVRTSAGTTSTRKARP
ncbi:MAG: glucose-6-phosphate dehydrogenase assembly protein OpcA [Actinobacteria bacterium]|nr:glucose-6-phosphate dehydrogenase assembly protein OpcA [Actinomycetota bacterium]